VPRACPSERNEGARRKGGKKKKNPLEPAPGSICFFLERNFRGRGVNHVKKTRTDHPEVRENRNTKLSGKGFPMLQEIPHTKKKMKRVKRSPRKSKGKKRKDVRCRSGLYAT